MHKNAPMFSTTQRLLVLKYAAAGHIMTSNGLSIAG
jgi:hypothetical protein